MKKLILPAAAFLMIAVASCKEEKGKGAESSATTALQPSELFQKARVAAFLKSDLPKDSAATSVFMKGLDEYRNNKNPKAASTLFVESLCLAPTAKGYYELGNVRIDLKDYEGAVAAYDMAEQLGYEPLSRLLYNKACALSLGGDGKGAVAYMQYAVEAGYTNSAQLLKDPDLAAARETEIFQTAYKGAMEGAAEPEVLEWQSFRREFPAVQLPLKIGAKTTALKEGNDNQPYIAYDFERFVPEMRGQQFSREVSKEFYYYARVQDAPGYTALIYSIRDVMMGDLAPECFVLATYDARGKIIDKLVVGGKDELDKPRRTATISPALEISVASIQDQYEKDPAENGYYDNKVVGRKELGTAKYKIAESGKIVREGRLIGMR